MAGIELKRDLATFTPNSANNVELVIKNSGGLSKSVKVVKENAQPKVYTLKSEEAYVSADLTDDTEDITGKIDINGDGKITNDELDIYLKGGEKNASQADTQNDTKTSTSNNGRSEDGTINVSKVFNLTAEEIANMSPEELVELYKDAANARFLATIQGKDTYGDEYTKKLMETYNAVGLNMLLMSMVSKMSDEQLDEFMKKYREMYPTTKTDDNTYMFGSYESIASNIMWTMYTHYAGLTSRQEVNEFLERMRKYFPKLNDPNGSNGIVQWS